jgi:hypothetical protein
VESAVLVSGDELQIGKFRLVFVKSRTATATKPEQPPTADLERFNKGR